MVNTTMSKYVDSTITNPFFIGFESLFDRASKMMENSYPPYNVISYSKKDQEISGNYDADYEIELAVAGFHKFELDVTEEDGILTITGDKREYDTTYIHKGIATRKFTKQFTLAKDVKVVDVSLNLGILHISLKKEEKKSKANKLEIID